MCDGFHIESRSTAIAEGIECHGLDNRPSSYVKDRVVNASTNENFSPIIRDLSHLGKFWLPAASEKLDLSPNLDDYVLTITISMPSDLPNCNGVAFPLHALTEWHTDDGMPMYETWKGKPVCYEHDNNTDENTDRAKGIILDCKMAPLKNTAGDIWKVIKLLAIDRTKDSVLANDILTGRRKHYSMGAKVQEFECSICGQKTGTMPCPHLPAGPFTTLREFNGVLAFKNTVYPIGKECSSVSIPAYYSASDSPLVGGE